jgi:hypothetical protein
VDEEIVFSNAHIQTLFCIDTGFLADQAELTAFNEWRTQDNWRELVQRSISATSANELSLRGVLQSAFAHTEWGTYRSTLTEPPGRSFLPLEFERRDAKLDITGSFSGSLKRILLSTRGALCFIYEERSRQPDMWLSALELIRGHGIMFKCSRASVEGALDAFCKLWDDSSLPGHLKRPSASSLWPYVLTYELIDIDLGLRSEDTVEILADIKQLYNSPPTAAGMDLVAVTRMSEKAAINHKNTRVSELRAADLGYRSDELWALSGERLVRCFPERDEPREIAFFEDVMSAAAILLQQRAARDSIAMWASSQRYEQYKRASSTLSDKGDSLNFYDDIRKALAASGGIEEPSLLFIGTRNTFYGQVVSELVRLLGIEERRKSALEAVQQFAAFSETMSSYNLQESQLSLSRAAKRLAWASVLLAVVALVIGAVQIYLAISGS